MATESVAATHENIDRAINLINSQPGGGGTELAAALKKALALPSTEGFSRSVVVITDGYIAAEAETFELVEKNLNRCNFFSFGIGTGVNRHLIEGIAKAGMGEPFVVTRQEEAQSAAARFNTYVQSPLLTGIEVQFNGFEAYEVEPPKVPDLFAGRPLIIFGKWRGEQKGSIVVSGQGGRGGYYQSFDVSRVEPAGIDDGLRYLWARSKVARLSDFAVGNLHANRKEEITSLGIQYSLLTQYTSFVAVLEQIRNTEEATDVNQPLPLPQGVSNLAVGGGVMNAPEPELALLLFFALLIAAVLCFRKRPMNWGFRR
jgi:Ca-activated chloride channel homolog